MTKHIQDEALTKMGISLDEAEQLTSTNMKLLKTQPIEIGHAHARAMHKNSLENPPRIKSRTTRARNSLAKNRLEKAMHRLYNLESANAPEKSLTLDLDVDLYQMEKY